MWAKAKEVAKKGSRSGDLRADERCSPAVLVLLRSTHTGRTPHRRKIGTVRTKRRRRGADEADEVEEQAEL